MINENVKDYIKNLVLTKYDDYNYYTCYTHTNYDSYNNNIIDITCSFTNDDSSLINYTLIMPNSVTCDIDTNTYNYNSSNKLERIRCYSNNVNVAIANHEVIYTNINQDYPNLLAKEVYDNNHNISYNIDLNSFYLLFLFLSVFLIIIFLRGIFND